MAKKPNTPKYIELTIDDLSFGARGVARKDNFVWFVDKGIPGQKVRALIRKKKKSFGEAIVSEILEPSPHQVDPPCPHFGVCGGCQLQHLDYAQQVEAKTRQVRDVLTRLGGLKDITVLPTIPAKTIYAYRNKMEFSFGSRRWLTQDEEDAKPWNFALGLHAPRSFEKVLDIDICHLQSERANNILTTVKRLTFTSGLLPYDTRSHVGFWRFFILREGANTADLMVSIITSGQEAEHGIQAVDTLSEELTHAHPEITTLVHGITDSLGQVAVAESERVLFGPGHITDKLGERTFEISPAAFFQTNTKQAEILFEAIADLADLQPTDTLYDLYCGTGAIGIFLADRVSKVLGIEAIPTAIADARRNARRNGLDNINFVLADMKDALKEQDAFFTTFGRPDVAVLDPPRGGTHPKTIKHLLALAPPKLVYVSCNPAILARDLAELCAKTYAIKAIQPVDMFPHTKHIEVVTVLERKDS